MEATERASLVGRDGTQNRALVWARGRGGSWGRGGIEVQLVRLDSWPRLRPGVLECKQGFMTAVGVIKVGLEASAVGLARGGNGGGSGGRSSEEVVVLLGCFLVSTQGEGAGRAAG